MGRKWDIDKIHCHINISQGSNSGFFDSYKIHELFSKEVSLYFDRYGLDYEIIPSGGMGGGGGSNILIEALRSLWHSKEIIVALIKLIELVFAFTTFIKMELTKKINIEKPRITIGLGLTIDKDPVYSNIISASIERLIMLKQIADDICNNLRKDHSIFNFDQYLSLTIYSNNFSVNYKLDAGKQNTFNTYRLIRLIKNLYIKDNVNITYDFTRWNFITRFDDKLNFENKSKMTMPYKKYYIFLSTRIIEDYFEIIKNFYKEIILSYQESKNNSPRG